MAQSDEWLVVGRPLEMAGLGRIVSGQLQFVSSLATTNQPIIELHPGASNSRLSNRSKKRLPNSVRLLGKCLYTSGDKGA